MLHRVRAALAVLLLSESLLLAAADWTQVAGPSPSPPQPGPTPIPIAYALAPESGAFFLVYGNNGTTDLSQTFEAADVFCRAYTSGTLASVNFPTERAAIQALDSYLNNNMTNAVKTASSNGTCSWFGLDSFHAPKDKHVPGSFTDGSDAGTMLNTVFVDKRVFNVLAWCGAQCNGTWYMRDCDLEANAFICKTMTPPPTINASGVVMVPLPKPQANSTSTNGNSTGNCKGNSTALNALVNMLQPCLTAGNSLLNGSGQVQWSAVMQLTAQLMTCGSGLANQQGAQNANNGKANTSCPCLGNLTAIAYFANVSAFCPDAFAAAVGAAGKHRRGLLAASERPLLAGRVLLDSNARQPCQCNGTNATIGALHSVANGNGQGRKLRTAGQGHGRRGLFGANDIDAELDARAARRSLSAARHVFKPLDAGRAAGSRASGRSLQQSTKKAPPSPPLNLNNTGYLGYMDNGQCVCDGFVPKNQTAPVTPPGFTQCAHYAGNIYCASPASTPFSWADGESLCETMTPNSMLATIESDDQMAFINSTFALNASYPGMWIAGAQGYHSLPWFMGWGTPWLQNQTQAIAAANSSQAYSYTVGGSSAVVGNCANGQGCAIGLMLSGSGNTVLQYVDATYAMPVLCRDNSGAFAPKPYGSTPQPPPPATPRDPHAPIVKVPSHVTLTLSSAICKQVNANSSSFSYDFANTTAAGWNANVASALAVLQGDVDVNAVTATCSGRRSLLQSSSTVVTVVYISMPPGTTAADAQAAGAAFAAAQLSVYASGQFASSYYVTGVTVVVDVVTVQQGTDDSSKNNVPLIIGLTVGIVGGLILAGLLVLLVLCMRKRRAVTAEPATGVPVEDATPAKAA